MKYKTIGEYLEAKNKTEVELAREVGISQAHLNEIKNGKKRPSADVAAKIEAATGIPFRDLLLPKKSDAA